MSLPRDVRPRREDAEDDRGVPDHRQHREDQCHRATFHETTGHQVAEKSECKRACTLVDTISPTDQPGAKSAQDRHRRDYRDELGNPPHHDQGTHPKQGTCVGQQVPRPTMKEWCEQDAPHPLELARPDPDLIKLTAKDAYSCIMQIVCDDAGDPTATELKIVNTIEDLYKGGGMGADLAGKTAYGLLNAVTEFYDYNVGRVLSNKLNSSFWGQASKSKTAALEFLTARYEIAV